MLFSPLDLTTVRGTVRAALQTVGSTVASNRELVGGGIGIGVITAVAEGLSVVRSSVV